MPTYQYECSGCDHAFEVFQSMTDAKLTECPACNENKLHRLIGTGGGIIFKGSGFYETDYKKKDAPKQESAKSNAKPAETKKESESKETASSVKES